MAKSVFTPRPHAKTTRQKAATGTGVEKKGERRREEPDHREQQQNSHKKTATGENIRDSHDIDSHDGAGPGAGPGERSRGHIDYQTLGLKCMYTNVDTFNNKRIEFEARVRTLEPDIIGITEVNPKNASWRL